MDIILLHSHVRLCKKNLKNDKVKCCASCPFEEEIVEHFPDLKDLFISKREKLLLDEHFCCEIS